MKLKDSLYSIAHCKSCEQARLQLAERELVRRRQSVAAEEPAGPLSYEIRLNPSHPIYQAHFPGEPITPGVCIIQIAKELLEHSFCGCSHLQQCCYELQTVKNVKYLSPISPIDTPIITYTFQKIIPAADGNTIKAQALVEANGVPMTKLSFTLAKKKGEEEKKE